MPSPKRKTAARPPRAASAPPAARRAAAARQPLAGYELLVCVSGGIAAYKSAYLVSLLAQEGCGVTVAMTRNARRFIGEVTFAGLSGRAVLTGQWGADETGIPHLRASAVADALIVAPATANILAKLSGGIADDLVSALLLGAACPVLLAPAMNANMWRHPAVQRNVEFLRAHDFKIVGPDEGWQACRDIGPGRMSEPAALADAVRRQLLSAPPKRGRRARD